MMISAFGGVINAPDQCGCSRRRQAKLRSFMTRQYVSVRVGSYARNDAYQDILHASARHNRSTMINMPSASGLLPGGKRSSNSLMGHYAL